MTQNSSSKSPNLFLSFFSESKSNSWGLRVHTWSLRWPWWHEGWFENQGVKNDMYVNICTEFGNHLKIGYWAMELELGSWLQKNIYFILGFSTIEFSGPESVNNVFVRQILIHCILSTYPGTLLTLLLIFLIILSKGLSLLLIFPKNKVFFLIDHFYCFHFVIILFH